MIITVKKYMEFQKLQKLYKDDNDKLGVEIIKLFSEKDIKQVSLEESDALIADITAELSQKDLPLVHRFTQDGVSFGFIPNLEDLTVGEFIDLDALMKQDDLQLEQIMSILYRPIKKRWFNTYSIEEYTGSEKYIPILLKTDFKIILGAIFFFAILRESLYNHITTYTPQKIQQEESKKMV